MTTSQRKRRLRLAAAVTAAALLLVACSGSGDAGPSSVSPVTEPASSTLPDEPETTTSTTSTTTTSTTPAPVVDTVPSSVDTEPQPDTTAAPEPPAPANTMFDPATREGEVEQAALADLAAFVVCLEQLPNCDVEAASQHSALEYREVNAALITEWNEAGYEARKTEDYNYRVDQVAEFSDDGTEAVVLLCTWGGTQLYAPATGTTQEEIIDGDYESSRERVLVRRLGPSWFVTALEVDEASVGEANNLCI